LTVAELFKKHWKTRKGENWCYWIDYYIDGKRVRTSTGTQKIKEAEAEKRRIERDVEDGCHVRKRGTVTFAKAYQAYLDYMPQRGVRQSTQAVFRRVADRHVLPELGSIRLTDLTTERIQAFVNAKATEYRWSYISKGMVGVIWATLAHAVKRKWLARHVLRDDPLELPLHRRPRQVTQPTTEQVLRLFASLAAGPPPGRQLNAFHNATVIVSLAGLGLRRGEVAGLSWEDVDFERCQLHVRRSQQARGGGLGPTKTASSVRTVPLPVSVRDLLWHHVQR
jgi:integrase